MGEARREVVALSELCNSDSKSLSVEVRATEVEGELSVELDLGAYGHLVQLKLVSIVIGSRPLSVRCTWFWWVPPTSPGWALFLKALYMSFW